MTILIHNILRPAIVSGAGLGFVVNSLIVAVLLTGTFCSGDFGSLRIDLVKSSRPNNWSGYLGSVCLEDI